MIKIIGIDPGLSATGVGIVRGVEDRRLFLWQYKYLQKQLFAAPS